MNPGDLFPFVNGIASLTWLALMVRPRHAFVLRWSGQMVPMPS